MDSRTVMELVLVAVLAVLGIAMTVCESRRVAEPTTVQTTPYRSVLISGMTAALAATVLFVAALWEHAGMYSILAAGAYLAVYFFVRYFCAKKRDERNWDGQNGRSS